MPAANEAKERGPPLPASRPTNICHVFGGIGKNWYRKKVPKEVWEKIGTGKKVSETIFDKLGTGKVSEPVSEKIGIGKKSRNRYG